MCQDKINPHYEAQHPQGKATVNNSTVQSLLILFKAELTSSSLLLPKEQQKSPGSMKWFVWHRDSAMTWKKKNTNDKHKNLNLRLENMEETGTQSLSCLTADSTAHASRQPAKSTQTHRKKEVWYSTGPTTHLYPRAGWTESQHCREEKIMLEPKIKEEEVD